MEDKFNWITGDETSLEIANHFGGSIYDMAKAFEIWAKIKHRKMRYKLIDLVTEYIEDDGDMKLLLKDIHNHQF
jgi:hypothetical protein